MCGLRTKTGGEADILYVYCVLLCAHDAQFLEITCAMRIIHLRTLWKTPDCCKIKKEAASAFQGLPLLYIYSFQAVTFYEIKCF
jgi:hypothetical protein